MTPNSSRKLVRQGVQKMNILWFSKSEFKFSNHQKSPHYGKQDFNSLLRKECKSFKNGTVPIYLSVTIDGTRMDFSTGKNTEPAKWSSLSGKLKGNSVEACSINSHLDSLKMKVYTIESFLLKTQGTINHEIFKNKFLGIEEKKRTIIPIFEEHNKRMQALIPKQFSPNTLKKFKTTLKHLQEFLLQKHKLKDIDIKQIDLAFINDLDFYLRSTKECCNNSTVKCIRNRNIMQEYWILK